LTSTKQVPLHCGNWKTGGSREKRKGTLAVKKKKKEKGPNVGGGKNFECVGREVNFG